MKKFFVPICILLLVGCSQRPRVMKDDSTDLIESYIPVTPCLIYDKPLNGYDVSLRLEQAYAGNPSSYTIEISLKRSGEEIKEFIPDVFNFERFFSEDECFEIIGKDTTVIHNTHKEIGSPFFDCHNIVYFEDVDFDGKDELVICNSPCQHSAIDILDCEAFLVYEVHSGLIRPSDNRYTRKIAKALCRTEYTINRKNKTVTLTGYGGAAQYTKEVFWFKNGQPYKLDYINVDGEKKDVFHFTLDNVDAAIDSIELSRYYNGE